MVMHFLLILSLVLQADLLICTGDIINDHKLAEKIVHKKLSLQHKEKNDAGCDATEDTQSVRAGYIKNKKIPCALLRQGILISYVIKVQKLADHPCFPLLPGV